jgi:hypothetical protein
MKSSSLRIVLALSAVLLLSIALSACQQLPTSNPTQSPLAAVTPLASEASAIPLPKATMVTPESAVSTGKVVITTVPAASAGYGIVLGTILEKPSGAPPTEAVMYLGALVGVQDNFPLVTVDQQTSPKAIPSVDTGRFIFLDVPPGEYGLVYWTPDTSFPVEDPNKPGITLILKVRPGATEDVGTVQVLPH